MHAGIDHVPVQKFGDEEPENTKRTTNSHLDREVYKC